MKKASFLERLQSSYTVALLGIGFRSLWDRQPLPRNAGSSKARRSARPAVGRAALAIDPRVR